MTSWLAVEQVTQSSSTLCVGFFFLQLFNCFFFPKEKFLYIQNMLRKFFEFLKDMIFTIEHQTALHFLVMRTLFFPYRNQQHAQGFIELFNPLVYGSV